MKISVILLGFLVLIFIGSLINKVVDWSRPKTFVCDEKCQAIHIESDRIMKEYPIWRCNNSIHYYEDCPAYYRDRALDGNRRFPSENFCRSYPKSSGCP